jgi:hypothetical protein
MFDADLAYTDLLIRVRAWDETRHVYPVEAWIDGDRHFLGGELRPDAEALREAEDRPQDYGLALFYALFAGPVRRAYDRAIGYAEAQTGGRLRVRLWIAGQADDLHTLVWERLHYPHQETASPLTTQETRPFSRYLDLEARPPTPAAAWPVRMLFAIANPEGLDDYGLAPLDIEREVLNLLAALGNLHKAGQVQITLLPGRTGLSDDLREQVARRDGVEVYDGVTDLDTLVWLLSSNQEPNLGYHLFHFLGHGTFDAAQGAAGLVLEDPDGFVQQVEDATLVARLRSLQPLPHLVFLASCESARRSADRRNPFVGLAPQLIQAGVPAVVAMQDVVSTLAARELTQDFYRYLLEHGTVDRAMNEARLQLYERGDPEWAVPTLFMRLRDGQVFAPDPLRQVLNAIVGDDLFNPLPADEPYLPLEVLHIAGPVSARDLYNLAQEDAPSMALTEAVLKICDPGEAEYGAYGPTVIALIGDDGMGKSVSLCHVGRITAEKSLRPYAQRVVIPVYVDLRDLGPEPGADAGDIADLVLAALAPFWGGVRTPPAEDVLREQAGPILRVIVDGSDDLPDHVRHRAWTALNAFIMAHPRHEYLVALHLSQLDTDDLRISDVLMMQPISQRNVRRFLTETLTTPAGATLYRALEAAQLFDLAAKPWLLFEMLHQTQAGNPPRSHVDVLRNLVDQAVLDIASDQGMRARAARSLYALAWEMQTTRRATLPVDEAFALLHSVRGNRGYNLEAFYQELIQHELLEPVGAESMRFFRGIVRDYCFAKALLLREDWRERLSDIAATLGRYNRYRWWANALTLLSGLLEEPAVLIREILYGVALGEGEQIFLAARCIQESANRGKPVAEQWVNYVAHVLIWQLTSGREAREIRIARRVRLIEALEQLQLPATLPTLVNLVQQPLPSPYAGAVGGAGDPDTFGTVHLAAALALHRMMENPLEDLADPETQLARVLNFWREGEDAALIAVMEAPPSSWSSAWAVAAFALGDLKTERATDFLIATFLTPGLESAAYRLLVTALSLLDTSTVTQQAILPKLQTDPPEAGAPWYPYLAYLIGRIRTPDPAARNFLYRCLRDLPDVRLKALAIQSLGWLYDVASKARFEDIALGDFTSLNLPDDVCLAPAESQRLQRKALEALRFLGDEATLRRLQARPAGWSPELEHAFYWTIEEIVARQHGT